MAWRGVQPLYFWPQPLPSHAYPLCSFDPICVRALNVNHTTSHLSSLTVSPTPQRVELLEARWQRRLLCCWLAAAPDPASHAGPRFPSRAVGGAQQVLDDVHNVIRQVQVCECSNGCACVCHRDVAPCNRVVLPASERSLRAAGRHNERTVPTHVPSPNHTCSEYARLGQLGYVKVPAKCAQNAAASISGTNVAYMPECYKCGKITQTRQMMAVDVSKSVPLICPKNAAKTDPNVTPATTGGRKLK